MISVYSAAICLAFLQIITKVAAEKNSRTVFPLPIVAETFLDEEKKG